MADVVDAERKAPEGRGSTVSDRVLGAVGLAMIVGAIWLLLFGGPSDGVPSGEASPPQLELVAPAAGESIPLPLQLRFNSTVPLNRQPSGWGAEGYHVHAEIDGTEVMPGPTDIRRGEDGSYVWTINQVSPGEREVRLVWSDSQHRPVVGGGTERVSIGIE